MNYFQFVSKEGSGLVLTAVYIYRVNQKRLNRTNQTMLICANQVMLIREN